MWLTFPLTPSVGRIVAGLGNGINTSSIPIWHAELMKAKSRGKGLCIELAVNIFGVMTAYWVDYGMSFVENESQFRFPLAFQCAFAVATMAGTFMLPESPRWLVAHDRHDEARHILWRLEPDAPSILETDPRVIARLSEIQHAINEERAASSGASFKALFKNGEQRFFYRTSMYTSDLSTLLTRPLPP